MIKTSDSLYKFFENIAKEKRYENYHIDIQPISSGGANYSSTLYVAKITAPLETLDLFAKVANIGQEIRQQSNIQDVFKQEYYFYNTLVNIFKQLEDKHHVPEVHRLVLSKYYGSITEETQETIVLEDLTAKGYKLYDRMKPVTWEYAAKAVEVLAKFHALSLAYSHESPEEFKKLRNINVKETFGDVLRKMFETSMFPAAYKVIKDENKDKVKKYFNENERFEDWMNKFKPVTRPVLAHGDYRSDNLMYRYCNEKVEVIPLDFQVMHFGSPVFDLIYFIYLGSNDQFRKLHYKNLIEHYYTQLKLALQRLHVDIDDVYPREDFETDLDAHKMNGLMLGLTGVAMVTVNEADTPDLNGDMYVKSSDVGRQRVNEIVDEYVEKGLLK